MAEQRRLEEARQKEMERVAQLERERQQEEIWRREEAERREVERRVAAEREEVERLRRVVEEKERQRMEHEQYLIAEENRRRQEMAAQRFVAEQQRREAMEMERKRTEAAEEQQRLEYERIVEERKVLLRRRQQLDILERQQQEELRLRQRNAVREPGPKHGLVNPMYSNNLNTRGRGAPRGRGICMPPPPSQIRSQHVGCMEADDGDFVNPLFSNYHNIKRGRGAQRGSGARMPPPHMPPGPPHMPQPVNMSTRSQCGGRGGRGGDNNHGDPYIDPPGEQLGDGIGVQEAIKHANMMPPQGRPGDWECGYCGNINFARRDKCNMCKRPQERDYRSQTDPHPPSMSKGHAESQRPATRKSPASPVATKTPTSLREHFEKLQVHNVGCKMQIMTSQWVELEKKIDNPLTFGLSTYA